MLDRDGTLVVDCDYLDDPAGLEFLPGAVEGLRHLHQRGYRLIVISNQSGVGRGLFSLERLQEINARLLQMVRAAGADLGRPIGLLQVDGGLTRSRVLMQAQADLLGVPVEVASSPHATAAGVGALARLGAGAGRTLDDVVRRDVPDTRYEPSASPGAVADAAERLARFERAVALQPGADGLPSP